MDHNGLYAELDNFTSVGTNSFNDTTCSALPSLSSYTKFPQSTSNTYQQQTIPDLNQTLHHHSVKATSTTTALPQTQININNCNNNIFFPHDDGLFVDATQAIATAGASCASTAIPQSAQVKPNSYGGGVGSGINAATGVGGGLTNNNHNSSGNSGHNFIGYIRTEAVPNIAGSGGGGGGGGGSGDSNITYNINNINTNIVNNINNPTNLVNSDIFGGNQYHQINKNGETIINFTNNNLNATTSMPADTTATSHQNFYGYQATNLNNNIVNNQGQQQQHHSIYESSVQSQSTHSSNSGSGSLSSSNASLLIEPNMGATKSMGSSPAEVYHPHHNHHHPHHAGVGASTASQPTVPPFTTGNASTILTSDPHSSNTDFYAEYSESLSAAKIINSFESKNPLGKFTGAVNNRTSGTYFKNTSDYPHHHAQYPPHPPPPPHLAPPHGANYVYQPPSNSIAPKISPNYDIYGNPTRIASTARNSYPSAYGGAHIDESVRMNYGRGSTTGIMPPPMHPYHHMPHPPHHTNYGNYYNNSNYSHHSIQPYSTYPPAPYIGAMRADSCSKTTAPNFSKNGAIALPPVDQHATASSSFPYAAKKDFYTNESHFYAAPPYHHPDTLNSCAKKQSTSGVPPPSSAVVHNSNMPYDPHHHHHSMLPHHQQNGSQRLRGIATNYQQMPPKHFNAAGAYSMVSPSETLSSCDYQSYSNYRHLHNNGGEMNNGKLPPHPVKNPLLSTKQFKTYNHYEPVQPPSHIAPHHYGNPPPQYHTMQVKHPEKIKISIDLEEQIAGSKIPKIRGEPAYGYDLHYMKHPPYYSYHRPRNTLIGQSENEKITNINISLRDFLSTWNEIDDDDESRPQQNGTTMVDELGSIEHIERSIMREYNPMFVQKSTDSIIGDAVDVATRERAQMEYDGSSEGTEKLYVLETIDVPISELNKYKHLSIINKLPENVVITDKELFTDMEINREKLYKSEFELEFEACEQDHNNKMGKVDDLVNDSSECATVEVKSENDEDVRAKMKKMNEEQNGVCEDDEANQKTTSKVKCEPKEESLKKLPTKVRSGKDPKIKILKLKKEKILKIRKTRIAAKRVRKYSLNQRTSSVKTLQSICIDFINTSTYRNYAREQLSISKKFSKMRVLEDFKKKFNFDGLKRSTSLINQKSNHSVRINSLREMCGQLIDTSKLLELDASEEAASVQVSDAPTLKELCKRVLQEMNVSVVESFSPPSLADICETFIYSNRQYFHIEEVSESRVPKLQDMCKDVLSATNIFVNIGNGDSNILTLSEATADGEAIYIVEENSGRVGELFESNSLNPHEKSEILRKIQRAANIDDDDEIIRAIGALHDDEENNNSNVHNKNISAHDDTSYLAYATNDELVQYEEIISVNSRSGGGEKIKKIVEILRHKYLNRSEVRQATRTINRILRKSLDYMRVRKFRDAGRKDRISLLVQQARCALLKLRQSVASPTSSISSSSSDSNSSSTSSSSSSSSSSSVTDEINNAQKIDATVIDTKMFESQDDRFKIDDYRDSPQSPLMAVEGNCREEVVNLPKMPMTFPSVNEYRIEQRPTVKDSKQCVPSNKRKLSFDESLLHINRMYKLKNESACDKARNSDKEPTYRDNQNMSTSTRYQNSKWNHRDDRHREKSGPRRRSNVRSRSRSRDRYRGRSERDNGRKSTSSYHNSSSFNRYDHYRPKDQSNKKHSETRRLVLPRYKLYDKDLDVKLKVRPIVRIKREERLDDLVKQYN